MLTLRRKWRYPSAYPGSWAEHIRMAIAEKLIGNMSIVKNVRIDPHSRPVVLMNSLHVSCFSNNEIQGWYEADNSGPFVGLRSVVG